MYNISLNVNFTPCIVAVTWCLDFILWWTTAEAVGDWFFGRREVKEIDCLYPCNPTCMNMVFWSCWIDPTVRLCCTFGPSLASFRPLCDILCCSIFIQLNVTGIIGCYLEFICVKVFFSSFLKLKHFWPFPFTVSFVLFINKFCHTFLFYSCTNYVIFICSIHVQIIL